MIKQLILVAFTGVLMASSDYTYKVYRLTPAEGAGLQQAYIRYSKAKEKSEQAWKEFEDLRYKASLRTNSSGVWCMVPTDDFAFLVKSPGCGE